MTVANRLRKVRRPRQWSALLWVAPAFAMYAVFVLYPMLQSVQYSFYDWDGIGKSTIAGLANYAAVFVEMIALPLIHTAWITALVGAIAHIVVLTLRLSVEDPMLLSNPDYAAAMGSKPRFLPGLF